MPYHHPRDIEHDLEHTIPPEGGPDSQFLFRVMTTRSLALVETRPGMTVLDLGCGLGQDTLALARTMARGRVLGIEPSNRMIRWGLGERRAGGEHGAAVSFLRAFGEELPLRGASADALLCKGALDHFIDPGATLAEVERVLKPGGHAVIALANYDSLACRLGRALAALRRRWNPAAPVPEHPHYEPPPDHLTRFGYRTIVALARPGLALSRVEGVSLLWGFGPWARMIAALPPPLARLLVAGAGHMARLVPAWADVIVIRLERRQAEPLPV
jgi:SAM-dependent methyltransferase